MSTFGDPDGGANNPNVVLYLDSGGALCGEGSSPDKEWNLAIDTRAGGLNPFIKITWVTIEDFFVDLPTECDGRTSAAMCNRYFSSPREGAAFLAIPFGATSGHSARRAGKGLLYLYETSPSTRLYSPKALTYTKADDSDAEVIYRSTNATDRTILQIKGADGLLNIRTNSTNVYKYDIQLFAPSAVGAKSGGVWTTNSAAETVYTVHNPAESQTAFNELEIVKTTDCVESTNRFYYSDSAWNAELANKTTTRRVVESVHGPLFYDEAWTTNSTGVSFRELRTYTDFGWGRVMITNLVMDGANNAIVRSYTYVTDPYEYGYTKIKQQVDESGWKVYTYDYQHRIQNVASSFVDTTPPLAVAPYRETVYLYLPFFSLGDTGGSPARPRSIYEYLGTRLVSATHLVVLADGDRVMRTIDPDGPVEPALTTTTRYFTSGPFSGQLASVALPDGRMTLYSYGTSATARTNIIETGQPNAAGDAIIAGSQTMTVVGSHGETQTECTRDIATGLVLSRAIYTNFDSLYRPQRIDYLDGTFELISYGCCGPETRVERDGSVVTYSYDALSRVQMLVRNGLTYTNAYDASGRLTQQVRIDTNGTGAIAISRTTYDAAGRTIAVTNALNYGTTFREDLVAVETWGRARSLTTTFADGGTKIESYYLDGQLKSVTGTAVYPARYEYGVDEAEAGKYQRYEKIIKLNVNYTDSTEWQKNYFDAVGNKCKSVYPDGSYEQSWFNVKGQQVKSRDRDGIISLFEWDTLGRMRISATDLNPNNDTVDYSVDRIRETAYGYVTNAAGTVAATVETRTYPTLNSGAAIVTACQQTSLDGLRLWSIVDAQTNLIETQYGTGGQRTVAATSPGGTVTTEIYQCDRLVSSSTCDRTGTNVLAQTSYEYDECNRRRATTDSRCGTTVYGYDALDRVVSVVSPRPGTGGYAQTNRTIFDCMGRPEFVIGPGSAVLTNEYFLNGLLRQRSGGKVYPVAYTYDAQGRMHTLTTWQDYAGKSGDATTTWNYENATGRLRQKSFADGSHVDYTYTPGGRIRTRTGGRGITTSYTYGFDLWYEHSNHGDPVLTLYGDGKTPGIEMQYDRQGRQSLISTFSYWSVGVSNAWSASGRLLEQSYVGGVLNGISSAWGYDALLRRESMQQKVGSVPLGPAVAYGYDTAGRLVSITDGTYSCAYGYCPGSPYWQSAIMKSGATVRCTSGRQYDSLNRLLEVSTVVAQPGNGGGLRSRYRYNDANERVRLDNAEGDYWVYEYGPLGEVVTAKRYWSDGSLIAGQQWEYSYDSIGNWRSAKRGGDADGAGLRASSLVPNMMNQYSTRSVPAFIDVLGCAAASASVSVSGVGTYRRGEYFRAELAVQNGSGPVVSSLSVIGSLGGNSATNTGRIVTPPATQAFEYDGDGNLTSDQVWTYTWDAADRLVSVETLPSVASIARARVSWDFDPLGRRMRQVVATNWTGSGYAATNETRFLYDGWQCVAELDSSNNLLRSYVWGLDLSENMTGAGGVGGLLWQRSPVGETRFMCYDGNGNVVGMVDSQSGAICARYEYDAFGNAIRLTGCGNVAQENPFRFSTKRVEEITGLVLYEYRPYAPSLGRWLNRDPIGQKGGASLYGYVGNNPVGVFDYLGLFKGKYHKSITLNALRGSGLGQACLDTIVNANVSQDDGAVSGVVGGGQGKPFFDALNHGDNSRLKETIDRIKTRFNQSAANACASCDDVGSALTILGQMLHALQDLYAHSNYVETFGQGSSAAGDLSLWGLWDSDGNAVVPSGVVSGSYAYPFDNSFSSPTHADLNKDDPHSHEGKQDNGAGVSWFDLAADAATRHSKKMWDDLLQTMSETQKRKLFECCASGGKSN